MRDQDPIVNLILGGDGTSRAFVKGWRDASLLPLSTGTNNVFPRLAEATGWISSRRACMWRVALRGLKSSKDYRYRN